MTKYGSRWVRNVNTITVRQQNNAIGTYAVKTVKNICTELRGQNGLGSVAGSDLIHTRPGFDFYKSSEPEHIIELFFLIVETTLTQATFYLQRLLKN